MAARHPLAPLLERQRAEDESLALIRTEARFEIEFYTNAIVAAVKACNASAVGDWSSRAYATLNVLESLVNRHRWWAREQDLCDRAATQLRNELSDCLAWFHLGPWNALTAQRQELSRHVAMSTSTEAF
jgi:hypothetical protein